MGTENWKFNALLLFFEDFMKTLLMISLLFLLYKKAKKEYVRKYVLTEEHINKLTKDVKPDSQDDPKDDKDTWKKWFKKHYKHILAGVAIVFGIYYAYSVYSDLYTQQEYLDAIVSGELYKNMDTRNWFWTAAWPGGNGGPYTGVHWGKEQFPPFVNLLDHTQFPAQYNFLLVNNVLAQIEDHIMYFDSRVIAAGISYENRNLFIGYDEIAFLEKIYKEITSGSTALQRLFFIMNLVNGNYPPIDGFECTFGKRAGPTEAYSNNFFLLDEEYIKRKAIYWKILQDMINNPGSGPEVYGGRDFYVPENNKTY